MNNLNERFGINFIAVKKSIFRLLLVFVCMCVAHADAQEFSTQTPIRIGFTRGIFINRNETDILAAMQVWVKTLNMEHNINIDPKMRSYGNLDRCIEAVQSKSVDAVTLLTTEYDAFPQKLLGGPFFSYEDHGSSHVKYVLLVRNGSDVTDIKHLSGTKLAVFDDMRDALAIHWLNAEFAKTGLGTLNEKIAVINHTKSLSKAVLSVFFGKNDACLVTSSGFADMSELNPQIARKLSVAATSPAVIPVLFAFRVDLPNQQKETLFNEALHLHESITGKQVLNILKADKMTKITSEEFSESIEYLRKWNSCTKKMPWQKERRSR